MWTNHHPGIIMLVTAVSGYKYQMKITLAHDELIFDCSDVSPETATEILILFTELCSYRRKNPDTNKVEAIWENAENYFTWILNRNKGVARHLKQINPFLQIPTLFKLEEICCCSAATAIIYSLVHCTNYSFLTFLSFCCFKWSLSHQNRHNYVKKWRERMLTLWRNNLTLKSIFCRH